MAVTDADNPYFYSTLSGTPTTQITDALDFPHSGLIKALSQGVRGNYAVKTANDFDITFGAATHSTIAVTAGKVYRDGKLHTVDALSALPLNTSYNPGTGAVSLIPISAGDVYLILVAKDGGSSNDTMVLRGSNGTHSVVPALVEGDVPIAIIKITAGSANGSAQQADRMVQYLTTGKVESSVSVGYNSSGYAETMSIIGDVDRTTFKNKIANADIRFVLADNTADEKFEILSDDDSDGDEGDTTRFSVDGLGAVNIPSLTASEIVITDSSKNVVSAAVATYPSLAELIHVKGATSSIQTQLDSKAIRTGDQSFGGSLVIDKDRAGSVGAETSKALHVDFDRLAQSTGTAAHNDIGIDLDVTSSSKGTSTAIGMDIDVVGAGTGTQVVKGLTVDVSGGDTNYAAIFNGGNVGIGNSGPSATLHIQSSSASTPQLLLESTDSGSSASPDMAFLRDSTDPINGDDLAHLKFMGKNKDAGDNSLATFTYADIFIEAQTVTKDSEDGKLHIRSAKNNVMDKRISLDATSTTFNEDSKDIDFRVESDDNANMLFVDGGNDKVGIGTGSPATTLDIGGNAQITNPDGINATAFKIDNADAGEIALEIIAANIGADVIDITADTVTTANVIDITADGLTSGRAINVVSNSAETNSRRLVNIRNDNTASVGTIPLYIQQDSTGDCIVMESTNDGAGAEPSLVFNRNSASPADGDLLGNMIFKGEDSGGNTTIYANIQSRIADTANTAEAGSLYYQMLHQGATKTFMYMTGSTDANGSTTFNYNGVDIDFIVNGENINNLIKVDASTDRVGIGTGSPANKLQISHTGADGSNGLMIVREDTSTADGDLLGGIGFDSTDGNVPSSVLESSAFIASIATEEHTDADKGGNLKFGVSLIDENEDVVSTVLASVGPPDTIANAACHAGFNSRATVAIVGAATYSPTITDSGTLVIFDNSSSILALPNIDATDVGVQFTLFNQTGSAINAKITVQNSATVNGGAIAALDDIASYKAATFVATGNNKWIRIG